MLYNRRPLLEVAYDPGCSLIPGVGSSSPFSNSGRAVKLSVNILAGSIVLSAVGASPPMMA